MADHYRLLGVTKSSSKEEIKEAFRKLAIQYHPDKHAQSSKSARDAATLKFKQVSEAYEVLIDDRKRAAYNLSRYNKNSSYSYHNNYDPNYYYRGGSYHRPPPYSSQPHRFMLNLDAVFRYMTTRAFLLNVAFAGYTPLSLSLSLSLCALRLIFSYWFCYELFSCIIYGRFFFLFFYNRISSMEEEH
ncbi:unnamed protein product [Amaranthus hypochondriacus]